MQVQYVARLLMQHGFEVPIFSLPERDPDGSPGSIVLMPNDAGALSSSDQEVVEMPAATDKTLIHVKDIALSRARLDAHSSPRAMLKDESPSRQATAKLQCSA